MTQVTLEFWLIDTVRGLGYGQERKSGSEKWTRERDHDVNRETTDKIKKSKTGDARKSMGKRSPPKVTAQRVNVLTRLV